MDAQFSAYAWANDQRIQQLTGQPFTQAYRDHILGAANARFDSGPATLAQTAVAQTGVAQTGVAQTGVAQTGVAQTAVAQTGVAQTAVAQTAPERELDALHALQHARYVEGRDNADPAVIADVLCSLALQAAAAVLHEPHDALRAALLERVASARATMQLLGAQGVPQLAVAGQGGASQLVGGDTLLGPREGLLARVQTAPA